MIDNLIFYGVWIDDWGRWVMRPDGVTPFCTLDKEEAVAEIERGGWPGGKVRELPDTMIALNAEAAAALKNHLDIQLARIRLLTAIHEHRAATGNPRWPEER